MSGLQIKILIVKEGLHNEELNDLYSSPNIVRVIKLRRLRWAGHVVRIGEWRGVYRVLVGKPEGKRPLGRPSHRWEDNIKMDATARLACTNIPMRYTVYEMMLLMMDW